MAKRMFFNKPDFDYGKFISMMQSVYICFYNEWSGEEKSYKALVRQGDSLLRDKTKKPFVSNLIKSRGDCITSDRECAAFAATYNIFAV